MNISAFLALARYSKGVVKYLLYFYISILGRFVTFFKTFDYIKVDIFIKRNTGGAFGTA